MARGVVMTRRRPRFVRDGASSERQKRDGRRGAVFSIRLTDEERGELEAYQQSEEGPTSLGAWLKWSALSRARSAGGGNTAAAPRHGSTRAAPRATSGVVAHARAESSGRTKRPRIVLDLCAGSGSWSAPYERDDYEVVRVTLPKHDVRTWRVPTTWIHRRLVVGVLAAPPCEAFSLAANGHGSKHERRFANALEVVTACLRIIALVRPVWWALENPTGYLSRWLGTPRDVWEPFEFGDPWTKRTAIWGDFEPPERGPFVKAAGPGPACIVCGDSRRRKEPRCSNPAHRAITPPGFARAFRKANP